MVLSIHQPSYFPWLGLLDKIRKSDVFMVMDEVQLADRAYQHRNLFLTRDGQVKFLTIPFNRKDYRRRKLREIEIAGEDWRTEHRNFIRSAYGSHPFAAEVLPRIEDYYRQEHLLICSAVVASMRLALELFAIPTRMIFQSQVDYDRSLRRGDLILALVRAVGADCYLSGTGAQAYLNEAAFREGHELRFNDFVHPAYTQHAQAQFHPELSCLDALFNLGTAGARALLKDRPS